MQEAFLYQKIPTRSNLYMRKVRCLACSWHCVVAEGQSGICGVRWNKRGKLYLTVYGKAYNGLTLDPVEKKPLYHFLPGTSVLSFGTLGCNFGCLFCQNAHMSQAPKEIKDLRKSNKISESLKGSEQRDSIASLQNDNFNKLTQLINRTSEDWEPAEIVEKALRVGATGIAYTYNEPAIFVEYACDTMKLAKKRAFKNIFVSNGFESAETLKLVGPYLDAANIDLKAFTEKFYREICKARLVPVLENIEKMHKMGVHLEITTLIIPTLNDSEKELTQIAKFIKSIDREIPWHVTAFHPDYKLKHLAPTPPHKVLRAREIGYETGLHYVYAGNIWGEEGYSSTICPKCGALLIKRGLGIEIVKLDEERGICKKCGYKIKGKWK